MENFYILYLICFSIVIGIVAYLIIYIKKENELYTLFSTDKDKMRELLSKDSKRFHISIIYLMTYLTRSNSMYRVQRDKFQMIIRYIVEVVPLEYQVDAIKALKYLTKRIRTSGKNTYEESIIDVSAFKKGDYQSCIKKGDDSYHYTTEIHGTRMANELALYLSNDDRMYVMYLLFRLTILDGIITTDTSDSELSMLEKLCVDGLKIEKYELDELINSFKYKNDQKWYEQHFENKDSSYPSSNLLANIFRVDIDELSNLRTKITKTSFLDPLQSVLIGTFILLILANFVYMIVQSDLINSVYPVWLFVAGFPVFLVLILMIACIKPLDSALFSVLRTSIEDDLQRKGFTSVVISSVIAIISLFVIVPNLLLTIGNETFANEGDTFHMTVPVTRTYTTTSKNSTDYHVNFPEISFTDKELLERKANKKSVSYINFLCLNSLPWLSGMSLWGAKSVYPLSHRQVTYNEYNNARGKFIRLNFKIGYFGLIYYDDYQLIDFNDEDDVIEDTNAVVVTENSDEE